MEIHKKPWKSMEIHGHHQERAQEEFWGLDPVTVETLDVNLDEEWDQMILNAEAAGFDVDEKARQVYNTGSIYLKQFLVNRGQLYSPKWEGYQEKFRILY